MIETTETRDEAYCSKIKGLTKQEYEVYEWFRDSPNSTDQEIASMSGLALASVNGRRDSLLKQGFLKLGNKKFCVETSCMRNTYAISTGNEGVELVLELTTTEMDHFERLAHKANSFQKKQIQEILQNGN